MKIRRRDFFDRAEAALMKAPGALRANEAGVLEHHFSDGVYLRKLRMEADMLALGHRHKTENFFFLMQGTLTITSSDGMAKTVSAPFVFKSSAGTRKMVYTHTAVEMCEVHPNPDNCTDVEALENRILTKSRASVAFERRKAIA